MIAGSDHDQPVAANLLNREFAAPAPKRRWVGDTTEFVIGGSGNLPQYSQRIARITSRCQKKGNVGLQRLRVQRSAVDFETPRLLIISFLWEDFGVPP